MKTIFSSELSKLLWLHITIASIFLNILQARPEHSLSLSLESIADTINFVNHESAFLPFFAKEALDMKTDMALLRSSVVFCLSLDKAVGDLDKVHVINVYSNFIKIKAP